MTTNLYQTSMRKIILFKSPENAEKYQEAFEKHDLEPIFIPVLEFKFTNLNTLHEKLNNSSNYDGIVITSQRAIEAIDKCFDTDVKDNVIDEWRNKLFYVVGETTNDKLYETLSLRGVGGHCGNANSLAEYIVAQNEKIKLEHPLLFPCGNLKSETLPNVLKEKEIALDSTVVYVTGQSSTLNDGLINLIKTSSLPLDCIFFSPSGVGFVLPILNNIGVGASDMNLFAIGPSTEKKILEMGYEVKGTASEPTPSGLVSCINKL